MNGFAKSFFIMFFISFVGIYSLSMSVCIAAAATDKIIQNQKDINQQIASAENQQVIGANNELDEEVFFVGLERIINVYISELDIQEVVEDGIKGALSLDKGLTFEEESSFYRLMKQNKLVHKYPKREAKEIKDWVALVVQVLSDAQNVSLSFYKFDNQKIYQAFFDGILSELDRFSRYKSPENASYHRKMRKGFEGIGIIIEKTSMREVVIKKVLPNSPADYAGLKVGFTIYGVEGKKANILELVDITEIIQNNNSEYVSIEAGDEAGSARFFHVRKDKIVENTVQTMVEDHVVYLKLTYFNKDSAKNIRQAIAQVHDKFKESEIIGYVLDLSGNPGGYLDQAVEIADDFLSEGVIVSAKGRNTHSNQKYDADPEDIIKGKPLVVFIDKNSASSSEIVAAALNENARAVLVGTRSYGKGTVQSIYKLPNDAELFLTWAQLYAPSGDSFYQVGLKPTVCLTSSDDLKQVIEIALKDQSQTKNIDKIEVASGPNQLTNAAAVEGDAAIHYECQGAFDVQKANKIVAAYLFSDINLYKKLLTYGPNTGVGYAK